MGLEQTLHPRNKTVLNEHTDDSAMQRIADIFGSMYKDTLSYMGVGNGPEYEQLIQISRKLREDNMISMKTRLEKTKYRLDSPETITMVVGSPRIEMVCVHYLAFCVGSILLSISLI